MTQSAQSCYDLKGNTYYFSLYDNDLLNLIVCSVLFYLQKASAMVLLSSCLGLSMITLHLITSALICHGGPISTHHGVTSGLDTADNSDVTEKRPDWLSVNRDLASIAAMIHLMRSDRIHSALTEIGKRNQSLLELLYRYHMFTDLTNTSATTKKSNQLSVDMPLSAISEMLSNERIRNNQRRIHSQLLQIGKRDIQNFTRS